jgi:prepilin-type N-terminal cleavage/methylation domain-containing protein
MKTFNDGFTLIELLIVIAIIAILCTIGIPYYQTYVVKAKLVEVEYAMAEVKDAVSKYKQENGGDSWPDCPGLNEIRNSLGIRLGAVSRISSLSVNSSTGTITATVDNVYSTVNGKTITLTPELKDDGSFSWKWGWSADFPDRFKGRTQKER